MPLFRDVPKIAMEREFALQLDIVNAIKSILDLDALRFAQNHALDMENVHLDLDAFATQVTKEKDAKSKDVHTIAIITETVQMVNASAVPVTKEGTATRKCVQMTALSMVNVLNSAVFAIKASQE